MLFFIATLLVFHCIGPSRLREWPTFGLDTTDEEDRACKVRERERERQGQRDRDRETKTETERQRTAWHTVGSVNEIGPSPLSGGVPLWRRSINPYKLPGG